MLSMMNVMPRLVMGAPFMHRLNGEQASLTTRVLRNSLTLLRQTSRQKGKRRKGSIDLSWAGLECLSPVILKTKMPLLNGSNGVAQGIRPIPRLVGLGLRIAVNRRVFLS